MPEHWGMLERQHGHSHHHALGWVPHSERRAEPFVLPAHLACASWATLSHCQRHPVTYLKIDREVSQDVTDSEADTVL